MGWRHRVNQVDRPPLDFRGTTAMIFSLVYISYAYTGWNAAIAPLAGEIEASRSARCRGRDPDRHFAGDLTHLGLEQQRRPGTCQWRVIRGIAQSRDGFDAVAPVAELAARQLFGPRVARAPLSMAIGLARLASLSVATVLTGPSGRVCDGPGRSLPRMIAAGRLTAGSRAPRGRHVLASRLGRAAPLDRVVRVHRDLRWRRPGPFFDAVGGLHLCPSAEPRPDLRRASRSAPQAILIVPAIFLAGTALLTLAAFLERPMVSLASLLSILAGMPVYYLWVRPRSRIARGRTQTPYVVSHSHLRTVDCVDA